MKQKITYELEKEDIQLLKEGLPDNPCDIMQCSHGYRMTCCGCPKYYDYAEKVKVFKENNLYDIALELKELSDKKRKLQSMKDEMAELEKSIQNDEEKYSAVLEML